MKVPFDHAVDREWFYGLRAVSVQPFPVSQTEAGFKTSIQRGPARRLGTMRRLLSTYPYQAANEGTRWLFRLMEVLRVSLSHSLSRSTFINPPWVDDEQGDLIGRSVRALSEAFEAGAEAEQGSPAR
jgi:hypothetical protein